jgi:D-alanyl-D-alanine carboxypeptidase
VVLIPLEQGAAQLVEMVPAGVAANPDHVSPAVTAFTAMPAPDRAPAAAATMRIAAATPSAPVPPPAQETKPRSGWMIQIGAFDDEIEAKQRLTSAQGKVSDLLRKADPFTESVTKGDKTLYRARFAGLDKDSAEAVCKQLKRNDIACFAIRN